MLRCDRAARLCRGSRFISSGSTHSSPEKTLRRQTDGRTEWDELEKAAPIVKTGNR